MDALSNLPKFIPVSGTPGFISQMYLIPESKLSFIKRTWESKPSQYLFRRQTE